MQIHYVWCLPVSSSFLDAKVHILSILINCNVIYVYKVCINLYIGIPLIDSTKLMIYVGSRQLLHLPYKLIDYCATQID